ncbi:LysR family transcriptional regulator [Telluria mixta]|jgi:DNA-binding transcriptional LysR family regulator|uniref:LysR family transcriptional regulator n=3 Tax=Telluria group TaxID=2895353 RepID=A0A7X3KAC5_9BURK|nr:MULTISPECIES: LysR family transcriptional regulator [Telluria group]MDN4041076.1 LysR family transcriptional regulator [Massilia sp. YIM B02787]KGF79269.1 LysR family transcriptional regulator [Massilia sp. JS1662]KQY14220.1 LysR family transcriptional regulator [Massilia sp. Root133]KQZ40224.1 LysR family transcriptional regulator [Massilia sp. Root1485]MCS0630010.1 LysR family transcriptional regulator [Telluria mixta]
MDTTNPNWFLKARLKTRQLLLLIALDDYRNIHRAADELHMTQPAASKQIKDLEEMLDVKLFERLPRGMEPTIYGETMIRHARMALTSLALAHDDIVTLKAGLTGQVEVGVIMTPAMALLPRAIARVKEEAPLLRIGVQLETSNLLLDKLQHGTLDFMIGRIFDTGDTSGLIYEELTEEPACAVVRPGHPLLERKNLTLQDIAPLPWIVPPHGSILRYRFDMMFRRAGLEPPANVVDTTAMLMITALLQQTDSLHVMPIEVAQYYASLNVMRILPIEIPCKMDAFGIIRHQDHLLSPGADLLLRAVRAAAKEIY